MNFETKSSRASKNTVFLGGLPGKADKTTLANTFSSYGRIKSIKMKCIDNKVGLNKGFAVIEFANASAFHACLKTPELYLYERVVSVQPYLKG
jgi:RNA recognition motif-containing protein